MTIDQIFVILDPVKDELVIQTYHQTARRQGVSNENQLADLFARYYGLNSVGFKEAAILAAAHAICDRIESLSASVDNIVEAISDRSPAFTPQAEKEIECELHEPRSRLDGAEEPDRPAGLSFPKGTALKQPRSMPGARER